MPVDWKALQEIMPGVAKLLGEMMVDDALKMLMEMSLTSDQAQPSVSMDYMTPEGIMLHITLSIEIGDTTTEDVTDGENTVSA